MSQSCGHTIIPLLSYQQRADVLIEKCLCFRTLEKDPELKEIVSAIETTTNLLNKFEKELVETAQNISDESLESFRAAIACYKKHLNDRHLSVRASIKRKRTKEAEIEIIEFLLDNQHNKLDYLKNVPQVASGPNGTQEKIKLVYEWAILHKCHEHNALIKRLEKLQPPKKKQKKSTGQ